MEYTLTKRDVEKLLGKSSKTVSRYIKSGKLTPIKKKVDGYITYLFSLDDIEEFKRGQSGHGGQDTTGQGTNGETFRTTEEGVNVGRVSNLNGGTQETREGTKQGKKDIPEDIGDRTQGTELIGLLRDTIDTLKAELEAKNKQIADEKQHTKDLIHSLQFAQNEAKEYRQMLALPTPITPVNDEVVVDTVDRTEDRTPVKEGTKEKTKHRGQGRTKTATKKKVKTEDKGQSRGQKTEKPKKRGLFSWIFKK